MIFKVPVIKETEIVTVRNEKKEVESVPVVVRDDGNVFISILSQVDWNKNENKKTRKGATKVLKKLRRINFDNASRDNFIAELELTEDQLEGVMHAFLIKDTPSDVKYQGVNMLITVDEFEEWYDEMKRDKKTNEEEPKE